MTEKRNIMSMSGFCNWPGLDNGHRFCKNERGSCECECHKENE